MTATVTTSSGLILGRKGLSVAAPLANGELLVSGYLTRWSELDRQSERMIRGAFTKSIPTFLKGHAPFVYGHRLHDVLGKVLELEEDAVGVRMVARVNSQPQSSPLRWVYESIKNGTIKGLSVGAFFKRLARGDGTNDIVSADIVECSATPAPVLATTGFEIVSEGKALEMFGVPTLGDRVALSTRLELAQLGLRARDLRERREAAAALRALL